MLPLLVIVFPEYFLTGATHDRWHAVRKMSGDKVTHVSDSSSLLFSLSLPT